MKRKALLIITAAAGIAAIVVVSTGAFAGTTGRSGQTDDSFAAFVSCLASHGVQVPSDDPAVVKPWLADHQQSDPAVKAAVEACSGSDTAGSGKPGSGAANPGPTEAELVACLEQQGVDVPADVKNTPGSLKPWLVGVMDQPSVKAALAECTGGDGSNGKKK